MLIIGETVKSIWECGSFSIFYFLKIKKILREVFNKRNVTKEVWGEKKKKKGKIVQLGLRLGPLASKPILLDMVLEHSPLAISGALGLWGGPGAERLGWILAMTSFPARRRQ